MANIDRLRADVAAQTSVIQSTAVLLGGLASQVRSIAAQASSQETPAAGPAIDQQLNELADQLEANTQALSNAVSENTVAGGELTSAAAQGTAAAGGPAPTGDMADEGDQVAGDAAGEQSIPATGGENSAEDVAEGVAPASPDSNPTLPDGSSAVPEDGESESTAQPGTDFGTAADGNAG